MKGKKYILTDITMEYAGHKLYRIKAVKNFFCIHKGDLGGWVESESNLSQEGECWIYHNAKVFDNAKLFGNARIYNEAEVFGYAQVFGNALISSHVNVRDNAMVYDNAMVSDNAEVCGNAKVCENVDVLGNAKVFGYVCVFGNAEICGDAEIKSKEDYAVFKNSWSSGRYFTWTRSNNKWSVGCFYGTGEELIAKAYADNEKKGKCYEAIVKAQELISNID